jgi:DNA-binding GntR family transcriptional regulator
MTLDRESAQPLYQQVAQLLEQDIAQGRFRRTRASCPKAR